MPTKKYEWSEYDKCASDLIATMMHDAGYSDRSLAAEIDNVVSYNRIRDLRLALKAPVRLSEFIAICQACHQDPVATLRRIIQQARARPAISPPPSPMVDDDRESRVEATLRQFKNDPLTLAANHSPYKYDGNPDTDDIA